MDKLQNPAIQVADYGAVTNKQKVENKQPSPSEVSVKNTEGESVCYACLASKNCHGACYVGSVGAILCGFFGFAVGASCGCVTATKLGWTLGSGATGACIGGIFGSNIEGNSKK